MTDIIITRPMLKAFVLGALLTIIAFSSTLWAAAVFYAGGQNVTMGSGAVITNMTMTYNSTDAATRKYVDARRPYYEGVTTATYNGSMGGLDGANAKCGINYPGSHMCTQAEMVAAGVTSISAAGWVACNSYNGAGASGACAGSTHAALNTDTSYEDLCATYNSNSATYSGISVGTDGKMSVTPCENSIKIHCCA